jgi:hypothetical protein
VLSGLLDDVRWFSLSALATLFLGTVLLRLPFVTPQTIKLLGVRRGAAVGRAAGAVLALVGVAAAAIVLLGVPPGGAR